MNADQLIESFRSDLRLKGQAQNTVYGYSRQVGRFIQFLYGKPISELDKDDLKNYLAHLRTLGLEYQSISLYFSSLSSFFDFLQEEDIIKENYIRSIRKRYLRPYKRERNERRIISVKDAIRLVNSIIDTRDRTMVLLLFKTGIRRKELIELDVDDINFENMSITLKPTPKRSNRVVFFDTETANQLKKWLRARESWISTVLT
jgi:integrase/recombinase XerD